MGRVLQAGGGPHDQSGQEPDQRQRCGQAGESVEAMETVQLARAMPFSEVAKALGISERALRDSNPALRASITGGTKPIPTSYVLNLPRGGQRMSQRGTASAGSGNGSPG